MQIPVKGSYCSSFDQNHGIIHRNDPRSSDDLGSHMLITSKYTYPKQGIKDIWPYLPHYTNPKDSIGTIVIYLGPPSNSSFPQSMPSNWHNS